MHVRSFLFLALSLLAWPNLASAEYGFWPLNSAQIPEAVKAAAQSVYKVYTSSQYSITIEKSKLKNLTEEELKKLIRYDEMTGEQVQVLLQEFEICVKRREDLFCTFSTATNQATVFALADGRMVTSVHVFAQYFNRIIEKPSFRLRSDEDKMQYLSQIEIPAALVDKENNLQGVRFKIDQITDYAKAIIITGQSVRSFPEDGLVLTVKGFEPKTGLKLAPAVSNAGEDLYALGFPAKTDNRGLLECPDADGEQLCVTFGKKMSLEEYKTLTPPFRQLPIYDQKIIHKTMVSFRGDAGPGMSGGPIVNAKGEWVAITHSLIKNPQNHDLTIAGNGYCAQMLMGIAK